MLVVVLVVLVVVVLVVDVLLLVETVVVVVTLLWLTTNCWPAMITVVLRGPPGLGATANEIFAGPVPEVGCTVIQSTNRWAVQLQVGPVVRSTAPVPPPALNEAAPALSPYPQLNGMVVVMGTGGATGGGAVVASMFKDPKPNGLPLQSFSVTPPNHCSDCVLTLPEN